MKDFLEELEIGEGKVKLSKEEIKSILAKHGEYIKIETDKVDNKYKSQLDDNKTTIDDLKAQIEKAPKSDEMESLKNKIADYEKKEADRTAHEKAKAEEPPKPVEETTVVTEKDTAEELPDGAIPGEIIAAIAAAVDTIFGDGAVTVKSIKRARPAKRRNAWKAAGMAENTRAF